MIVSFPAQNGIPRAAARSAARIGVSPASLIRPSQEVSLSTGSVIARMAFPSASGGAFPAHAFASTVLSLPLSIACSQRSSPFPRAHFDPNLKSFFKAGASSRAPRTALLPAHVPQDSRYSVFKARSRVSGGKSGKHQPALHGLSARKRHGDARGCCAAPHPTPFVGMAKRGSLEGLPKRLLIYEGQISLLP